MLLRHATAGTSLQGGKAALVSHYAAALQTMLAQSFPPPTTPTRLQSGPPSWDPYHTSSSSFSPADLFDLGSNPHLTPRYSQGAVALSHQLASASSHPCDVIQSATFLPSFRTTTHLFGQLPSATSSHVQRQICPNSSAVVLGGRARLTSHAASNERMAQRAHAAHTSIPSQAKRLSTRLRSEVVTSQHQQYRVADLAGYSGRASHEMQSAAAGECHLCALSCISSTWLYIQHHCRLRTKVLGSGTLSRLLRSRDLACAGMLRLRPKLMRASCKTCLCCFEPALHRS